MISDEQAKKIKSQLFAQLKNLPEDQASQIKAEIDSMNNEQLEEFLTKNNLTGNSENPFRLIIDGKIPSYKIAENEEAVAVLEINPVSKGHVIIISKDVEKKTEKTDDLTVKITELLKNKLLPKNIEVSIKEILGEEIINIIPIYENQNMNEKISMSKEQLKELQELLLKPLEKKKPIEKPVEKPKKIPLKELPKAPKRKP